MTLSNCKKVLLVALLTLAGYGLHAQDHTEQPAHEAAAHEEGEKKAFDAKQVIFSHISDGYDWHFFDFGGHPISLPLPVIIYNIDKGAFSAFSSSRFEHGHASYEGYSLVTSDLKVPSIVAEDGSRLLDFSITKNVGLVFISAILILLIFLPIAAKYKKTGSNKAPSGFQNAMEPLITFVRDEVAKPNIGRKYMKYMPFLLTIFFFIWISNMVGLIPGSGNLVGNIAFTLTLSVVTFVVMIFSGNKHFWGHLLNPPGVPGFVKIILVPIEIISLIIKPIALTIRLFANMLAGHIIIISFISLIFIFAGLQLAVGIGFVPVSILLSVFSMALEVLVAAIQAFIFANLAAVFIGQSVEEGHNHDYEHEEYHDHNPLTGQDYNVSEQEIIA